MVSLLLNSSIFASAGGGLIRIFHAADEGAWEAYAFAAFLGVWLTVFLVYMIVHIRRAMANASWRSPKFLGQMLGVTIPILFSGWVLGVLVWKLATR